MTAIVDARLTGRDDEIEALLGHLAEAMRGRGNLVLVSGEAGIGKTTLVDEAQRRATELGFTPLVGRCIPGISTPYLPFIEALRKLNLHFPLNQERNGSSIGRLDGMPSGDQIFHGLDNETIFFLVLRALREASAEGPLLLRLEDLHWSDFSSIELLYFLARNIGNMRVFLVCTYRTEDLQRAAAEATHPLVQHIQLLKKSGLVHDIELRQLDPLEMTTLAEKMLGQRIDPFLAEQMFKESHGNPLFIVETIKLLLSTGSISFADDAWRATSKEAIKIPSTVTEVVTRRMERLSKEQRRVVECAAVIGERFEPRLIEEGLRMSRADLLGTLDHLRDEQQLIVPDEDIYKFDHETIRRVAYEGISGPRRKELHRSIGLLLERRLPLEARYSELSYHFCNAKEAERCVRYSLLAGEEMLGRAAALEAMPFFQRALELGTGIADFGTAKIKAEEGLGDAYVYEGDAASAAQHFEEALKSSPQGLRRARLLRKMAECWAPMKLGRGSKAKSLGLCTEARSVPEIDADEEGEIGSLLTVIAMLEGDWEEAKRQALSSEDAFRRAQNGKKLSLQLLYNSDVFISTGELDRALQMVTEAEELNRRVQSPITQSEVDFHYGMVYLHRGQVEKAMPHYDAYVEISERLGHDSALSIVYFYKAMLLNMVGDFQAALKEAERSREYALKIGRNYLKAGASSALAHTYYNMRHSTECLKYAAEAYEIGSKFNKDMKSPTIGMILVAAAEAAQIRNEWEEAESLYKQAIAMFDVCAIGRLMKALALTSYGDALFAHDRRDESITRIEEASGIFSMLGNEEQMKRCRQALQGIRGQ